MVAPILKSQVALLIRLTLNLSKFTQGVHGYLKTHSVTSDCHDYMETQELLRILLRWGQAARIQELQMLSSPCDIEEIGDGNLNDVWRVKSREQPNQSLIIKHSPPYIKCIGPDSPLTVNRIHIEFYALSRFYEVHPECVPKPFILDDQHDLVIMEDLRDHVIMRKHLVAGDINIDAVKSVVKSIGNLHRKTHQKSLSKVQFEELKDAFRNDDMVALTHGFVFTNPFLRHHSTNRCSDEVKAMLPRVHDDAILQENAAKMRKKFADMKQCLLHGDLHTGSIMVNGQSAKMMDLEFAYVGPAAFDIGMLLANYIFSYYSHRLYPMDKSPEFHKKLQEATQVTLSIYAEDLKEYLSPGEILATLSDIAGFTGCELLRRIIGIAHVEDLEGRPLAEVECVDIGIRLLQQIDSINNEQMFLDCVFKS